MVLDSCTGQGCGRVDFLLGKDDGVYCRPSCAALPANPQNVRFHPTTPDAACGRVCCVLESDPPLHQDVT
ncbi:Ada metal-binding domain-containing protein [Sphingomonas aerolata]